MFSSSSMLQRVGVPSFFLLCSIPLVNVPQFFDPLIYWWALRLLRALGYCNRATTNIGVYRFFWIGVLAFSGYNPSNGITGSKAIPFFIFWGNSILFPTVATPVCIPTNSALGFPFLHNLSSLVVCWFVYDGHSDRMKCYVIVVFICISLMANDTEYPFIYLWALSRSSLEKSLFRSFVHF